MRVYRIYNKRLQRFKDEGGGYNSDHGFSKIGKIWKKVSYVMAHIRINVIPIGMVRECEVVEYELIERSRVPLLSFIEANRKDDDNKGR